VSPFDKPILLKINKDFFCLATLASVSFLRLYPWGGRYWCWYW